MDGRVGYQAHVCANLPAKTTVQGISNHNQTATTKLPTIQYELGCVQSNIVTQFNRTHWVACRQEMNMVVANIITRPIPTLPHKSINKGIGLGMGLLVILSPAPSFIAVSISSADATPATQNLGDIRGEVVIVWTM